MGLGDLFGVRIEKLNLKGSFETIKELYEAIKDVAEQ